MKYSEIMTEVNMGQKSLNVPSKFNYTFGAELEVEESELDLDLVDLYKAQIFEHIAMENARYNDELHDLFKDLFGKSKLSNIVRDMIEDDGVYEDNVENIAQFIQDHTDQFIQDHNDDLSIRIDMYKTEIVRFLNDNVNHFDRIGNMQDIMDDMNLEYYDVVTDESLVFGSEIIIGVYNDLNTFLSTMKSHFEAFDVLGVHTTERTGLHINIGTFKESDNIDWLKFLTFFDGDYVLKQFDREDNKYAASMAKFLKPKTTMTADDYKNLIDKTNNTIIRKAAKYQSVNLSKLATDGYIEIRALGGKDYDQKFNEIANVTKRAIKCLDIARNPEAYKKEYLKKLYKVSPKEQNTLSWQNVFDWSIKEKLNIYTTKELIVLAFFVNYHEFGVDKLKTLDSIITKPQISYLTKIEITDIERRYLRKTYQKFENEIKDIPLVKYLKAAKWFQ